jgi:hypothetical protein
MMKWFKHVAALAFCATVLFAGPVAASQYDTLKAGPAVGTKIPHDLNTVDHRNQHQDFKSLAHKRGLVILFSRSLDW